MNLTERIRLVAVDVTADVGLLPPFSARDLVNSVQTHWETPIELHPFQRDCCPLGEFSTGWCIFVGETFHIYYYADGGIIQQERIIYHELGHLVLKHVSRQEPIVLRRRGGQYTDEELLAEAFAEVMTELALVGGPSPVQSPPYEQAGADPYRSFLLAQER